MGLLDGLFGPKGSEDRLQAKMSLMGLTHRPNQQLMAQWSNDLANMRDERKATEKSNRTLEWMRTQAAQYPQLAPLLGAMETGGIDTGAAVNAAFQIIQEANKPADPWANAKVVGDSVIMPDGQGGFRPVYSEQPAADPQSAIAKLAADLRAGLITQEQYDLAVANMAPPGMSIESDGQGGFRMVQGPGVSGGMRPPTEGQLAGAGYLQRMTKAEEIMRSVERLEGVSAIPLEKTLAVDSGVEGYVLNPTEQRIIQAQRDWVRAKLRKESGAVIAPQEMAAEIKTYFPQPGEGPEVIRQKAEARRAAERQLEIGAGSAAPQAGSISPEYTPPIRMQDLSGAGIGGADASTILDEARQAIERGADPEAVKERLRQMGVDPGSL